MDFRPGCGSRTLFCQVYTRGGGGSRLDAPGLSAAAGRPV